MNADTPNQFSVVTVFLHWVVGLTMISLLSLGVFMVETETHDLYPLHKSFGFLIFSVVLVRVVWRLKNGWPAHVGQYSNIEQNLAKAAHWVLIIGTVLMPVSGFLMSSLGGYGIDVFGYELVALNIDPHKPGEVVPHNATIAGLSHSIHHWLGYVLIATVVLHIAGAIKHHSVDKDGTLKRMLGKKV